MTNARIFEPDAGSNAMLVATSTAERTWTRELRDFEKERNEREIRALMHNRTGVCG